jgi:hypothetical protein
MRNTHEDEERSQSARVGTRLVERMQLLCESVSGNELLEAS